MVFTSALPNNEEELQDEDFHHDESVDLKCHFIFMINWKK